MDPLELQRIVDHQSEGNIFDIEPDPTALQDVEIAHNQFDNPDTPLLLSAMDVYEAEYNCDHNL